MIFIDPKRRRVSYGTMDEDDIVEMVQCNDTSGMSPPQAPFFLESAELRDE